MSETIVVLVYLGIGVALGSWSFKRERRQLFERYPNAPKSDASGFMFEGYLIIVGALFWPVFLVCTVVGWLTSKGGKH